MVLLVTTASTSVVPSLLLAQVSSVVLVLTPSTSVLVPLVLQSPVALVTTASLFAAVQSATSNDTNTYFYEGGNRHSCLCWQDDGYFRNPNFNTESGAYTTVTTSAVGSSGINGSPTAPPHSLTSMELPTVVLSPSVPTPRAITPRLPSLVDLFS